MYSVAIPVDVGLVRLAGEHLIIEKTVENLQDMLNSLDKLAFEFLSAGEELKRRVKEKGE